MKFSQIFLVSALAGAPILEAAVFLSFSQEPGGVSLSYEGTLDTSNLSFDGGLTYSGRMFALGDDQLIEVQNPQPKIDQHPSHQGTSFRYGSNDVTFINQLSINSLRYNATSATGDTFGFYIFERNDKFAARLNLPWQYVSNSPIQGELRFDGESFYSMGLDSEDQFMMTIPGGDSVSIQVVPVPEPQGVLMCLNGLFLGLFRRIRK